MRPFPLGGSDIILGVDWLQLHNPITLDFNNLSIAIKKEGKTMTLQGSTSHGSLQAISSKSMDKLLHSRRGVATGCICMLQGATVDQQSAPTPPILEPLLQQFTDIFQEPQGLPPQRAQDHQIHLKKGSQPINQRGYRVPYVQKAEIER